VLFEVLLSIALFAGAAAFTLGASRSALTAIERASLDALALDLARAKLAELDAGTTSIAALREEANGIEQVGSLTEFGADAESFDPERTPVWELDVDSEPTEFTGLSLVTITVREVNSDATATLRQLVRLVEEGDERYDEDAMLRDLPAEDAPGPRPEPDP
jgi:hypothetical protein